MPPRVPLLAAAIATFCILATLNSGGYRYGVSDQAFYIPAILMDLDPGLFPRDRPLIEAQDPLMVFDEMLAACARAGISLEALFFALYGIGLVLLGGAIGAFGRAFYGSWTAVAAFGAVETLRHRIPKTAVNTLEGYLHPRMLAFAVGVWALAACLRGRWRLAFIVSASAFLIHPTTALWFIIVIGVAALVDQPAMRRPLMVVAALGAAAAVWMLWRGPLAGRLTPMDALWLSVLASKDYILPTTWDTGTWLLNLLYPTALVLLYRYRVHAGLARPAEKGLLAGALALFAIFLLSLPLLAMRIALAVQLQTSRVFWILDFLAVASLVSVIVEGPLAARAGMRRLPQLVLAALLIAASARGAFVMFVEHRGRPVVQTAVAQDDWGDVMAWAHTTPAAAAYLADPGHAWRYGTSVRVAAQRDVFLEEVKDIAIAMYARPVALRVLERIAAMGNYGDLTAERANALGQTYDLQYVITERPLDLPLAFANRRFKVYRLGK